MRSSMPITTRQVSLYLPILPSRLKLRPSPHIGHPERPYRDRSVVPKLTLYETEGISIRHFRNHRFRELQTLLGRPVKLPLHWFRMSRLLFFVGILFVGSSSTLARCQVDLDMNQIIRRTIAGGHDCAKGDWQFAQLAENSGLLKPESLPTSTCKAISLSWLPSAQIVQVTGWKNTDVFVSFTIIRATEASPLTLITAFNGPVINKDRENDETNKAAFNELLRISAHKPSNDRMLELGELYLFMVGHPPDETPKKLGDVMKVDDMEGGVSKEGGWTIVTVHQRMSAPLGNPHGEWVLRFRVEKAHIRLVSVAPETHS